MSDRARAVPLPSNDRSGASTPIQLLLSRPYGHDGTAAAFPTRGALDAGTVLTRFPLARQIALDDLEELARRGRWRLQTPLAEVAR